MAYPEGISHPSKYRLPPIEECGSHTLRLGKRAMANRWIIKYIGELTSEQRRRRRRTIYRIERGWWHCVVSGELSWVAQQQQQSMLCLRVQPRRVSFPVNTKNINRQHENAIIRRQSTRRRKCSYFHANKVKERSMGGRWQELPLQAFEATK